LPGETQPSISWYMPRPEPTPVPPTVPVTPRPPTPVTTTAPRVQSPPTPVHVIVDQGSEQASPPLPDTTATEVASIAMPVAPIAGARLECLQAPPRAYPRAASRMHSEGTVLLDVLRAGAGRPLRADVRRGSGDGRRDAAPRGQVLERWRFRPAMYGGQAVQEIGLVPVNFRL